MAKTDAGGVPSTGGQWPHLPNAPIHEAVLDIQLALPTGSSIDALKLIHNQIRDGYPTSREQTEWKTKLGLGPGGMTTVPPVGRPIGYVFTSADGRNVLQACVGSFTFSRLRPYLTWSALRDEARRLWRIYSGVAGPPSIHRIGLRYINRIAIPRSRFDVGEYSLIQPDIAPSLGEMSGFLMRVVLPFSDRFTAIVTEASEAHPTGVTTLILDIDIVHPANNQLGDEELWAVIEEMRELKNRVFFETVTQKTRELLA